MGRRREKRRLRLQFKRDTVLSAAAALLLLSAGLTFISFFAQAASVNFVIQSVLNKLSFSTLLPLTSKQPSAKVGGWSASIPKKFSENLFRHWALC